MVEVPKNTVTQADLEQWYTMADELRKLRAAEMLLRKKIFDHYFPDPKEGTNSEDLGDDFVLKGVFKYDRKIDEGAFDALQEEFRESKIKTDTLVKTTPSLKIGPYNKLNKKNKLLFDQCLIIKPGSPSLTITKPKGK